MRDNWIVLVACVLASSYFGGQRPASAPASVIAIRAGTLIDGDSMCLCADTGRRGAIS